MFGEFLLLHSPYLQVSSSKEPFENLHGNNIYVLTAVDSLDAKVISRLPLRPNSAGTTIYNSETSSKSDQC